MSFYIRWSVVVAAFALALAAACGGSDAPDTPTPTTEPGPTSTPTAVPTPTATPSPTATPTPEPTPTPSGLPAKDILEAASAAMEDVPGYRFTLDAEVEATVGELPAVIEMGFAGIYQAPDLMQASLLIRIGQSGLRLDTRTQSGTTYVGNIQADQWVEADQLRSVFPNPAFLPAALRQQIGTGARAEASEFGGENAYLVSLESLDILGEFEPHGRVKVWIDADEHLVRQVEASGSVQFRELAALLGSYGVFNVSSARVSMRLVGFGQPTDVGSPDEATRPAPTGPGQRVPEQGRDHVRRGELHPRYNSVPATSDWHYASPLAPAPWGVHYDCPEGCSELVAQLTGVVEAARALELKVIMTPYDGMGTRIALTAWTFLDAFDEFDADRIREFIRAHESSPNAPEPEVP